MIELVSDLAVIVLLAAPLWLLFSLVRMIPESTRASGRQQAMIAIAIIPISALVAFGGYVVGGPTQEVAAQAERVVAD